MASPACTSTQNVLGGCFSRLVLRRVSAADCSGVFALLLGKSVLVFLNAAFYYFTQVQKILKNRFKSAPSHDLRSSVATSMHGSMHHGMHHAIIGMVHACGSLLPTAVLPAWPTTRQQMVMTDVKNLLSDLRSFSDFLICTIQVLLG